MRNAAGDRLMAARWFSSLSSIVPDMFAQLGRPVRILSYGDSITEFCYRWDLWLLLSTGLPAASFDLGYRVVTGVYGPLL